MEAACFVHVAAPSEYVLHKGLMNKQIWYREAVHLKAVKRGCNGDEGHPRNYDSSIKCSRDVLIALNRKNVDVRARPTLGVPSTCHTWGCESSDGIGHIRAQCLAPRSACSTVSAVQGEQLTSPWTTPQRHAETGHCREHRLAHLRLNSSLCNSSLATYIHGPCQTSAQPHP